MSEKEGADVGFARGALGGGAGGGSFWRLRAWGEGVGPERGAGVKAPEPLRKLWTLVTQHDADSLFESFFRRGFSVSACDIRNQSYKG